MSERPISSEGIVSQIIGVDWINEIERDKARKIVGKHMEEVDDVKKAVNKVRRRHEETSEHMMAGKQSWRDFRSFVGIDILESELGEENVKELEENIMTELEELKEVEDDES